MTSRSKSKIHKNYSTITDRLSNLIEQNIIPWQQPWHNIKYQNLITQIPYGGINPILCRVDCLTYNHSSSFYIGKSQCNDRGWSIKKGSKANWLRWGGSRKIVTETQNDNGKIEQSQGYIRSFKWLMVFNIDCVDDSQSKIKIKDLTRDCSQVQKVESINESAIQDFVNYLGVDISHGGDQAYHVIGTNKIVIPHKYQFSSTSSYWAVLFHELVHNTAEELNRPLTADKKNPIYHQEELIADLGASFLGNYFGLASTQLEHHASYLKSYLSLLNNDKQFFFKASHKAQIAVNYLLKIGNRN